MTRGEVNWFIDDGKDELSEVKSDSQETHRLDVPRCFLDETIWFITQIVQACSIELVFDPREVGRCEWDDR
jgi:hypothetical protein